MQADKMKALEKCSVCTPSIYSQRLREGFSFNLEKEACESEESENIISLKTTNSSERCQLRYLVPRR